MTRERFNWIIRCIDFDRLTVWENKFLESCAEMMKRKGKLSERMEEILENIHREKS